MTEVATVETLTAEQAESLEAAFLGGLEEAQVAYERIVEHEAWNLLGFDTFTAWWSERVTPTMRALSMRPTQDMTRLAIEQVRAEEADLPPAQRRTQREVAEVVGVSQSTVSRSAPDADASDPDLDRDGKYACEACGGPMDADQYASGFMRCDACDGDEAHTAAGFPHGRDGGCATCTREAASEQSTDRDETPSPTQPVWSPDETELGKRLEAGETVVISLRPHHANLARWAESGGLLVRIDRRSEWGNPFELPADGDRDTVITAYDNHYLPHKPSLLSKLNTLRGKALGCWCAPEPCHGDILKARAG